MRSLCRDDRGQALVELALVLPLLLLIVFGIIDFGIAINTQDSATTVANYAARQSSVIPATTTSEPCPSPQAAATTLDAWVTCEASSWAPGVSTPSTVCVADYSGGGTTNTHAYALGDPVTVKVTVPFTLPISLGSLLSPTIKQTATMRLEVSEASNAFFTGASQCS
jgi:Flp pilus assembly protein TadG